VAGLVRPPGTYTRASFVATPAIGLRRSFSDADDPPAADSEALTVASLARRKSSQPQSLWADQLRYYQSLLRQSCDSPSHRVAVLGDQSSLPLLLPLAVDFAPGSAFSSQLSPSYFESADATNDATGAAESRFVRLDSERSRGSVCFGDEGTRDLGLVAGFSGIAGGLGALRAMAYAPKSRRGSAGTGTATVGLGSNGEAPQAPPKALGLLAALAVCCEDTAGDVACSAPALALLVVSLDWLLVYREADARRSVNNGADRSAITERFVRDVFLQCQYFRFRHPWIIFISSHLFHFAWLHVRICVHVASPQGLVGPPVGPSEGSRDRSRPSRLLPDRHSVTATTTGTGSRRRPSHRWRERPP
jgi:hypothetical protein